MYFVIMISLSDEFTWIYVKLNSFGEPYHCPVTLQQLLEFRSYKNGGRGVVKAFPFHTHIPAHNRKNARKANFG